MSNRAKSMLSIKLQLIATTLILLCAACAAPPTQPNIVIFLADDVGWKSFGFNGGDYPTPNIDRLASDGIRFAQFYVQNLCTPTRAALLTGRYPMRYGLQVGVIHPWDAIGLPLTERTLAESLKDAGYATAIVGKWHLGIPETGYLPTRRGFDRQYGSYSASIDYYSHEALGGLDWHRDDRPCYDEGHATDLTAREAVTLIEEHDRARPMFLYVPFQAAHTPRRVPDAYLDRFAGIESEKVRLLSAMLAQMDDAVAAILAALERRGMLDDTIVFFTTDNGADLTRGELRGAKGGMYEGGIRVPAALMWRRVLEGGTVVEDPVHVTDIYPTLLRLAGATHTGSAIDGFDIWPTLARGEPLPRSEILLHLAERRGAIRVGDWKLIARWNRLEEQIDWQVPPDVELFDLRSDPYEQTDIAARHPERVDAILERLDQYRRQAAPSLKGVLSGAPPDFRVPEVWGPQQRVSTE